MKRWAGRGILVLLLSGAAGCATTNGGDPRDPLEGFNRPMHQFNEAFDESIGTLLLRYARMIVARGYVHNSLGNLAIRVPHPDFEHGVLYTKHAEVSLEEMTLDNVVITDVPTGALLRGTVPTSVGHNLNREILRLRPDIHAVHGYDAARVIYEAVKALNGETGDTQKLIEAVRAVNFVGPRGPVSCDRESHQAILDMYLFEAVDLGGGALGFKRVETFKQVRQPGN